MKSFFIPLSIGFLLLFHLCDVESHDFKRLFNKRGVDELLGKYDKIQSLILNKTGLDCFPGSLFFNRSCYYFSKEHEKLSWFNAFKFCKKWGLNSTLLTIESNEELNFVIQNLRKIKNVESSREQLVFKIGFNYTSGSWKWLNNAGISDNSTNKRILNVSQLWQESEGMHYGRCGSIVLLETNHVILRSIACRAIEARFICTYALNACLNNTQCGLYGKCINLYKIAVCQCTSIFYGGEFCNELNSKAYQVIIASGIVFVTLLVRLILWAINLSGSTSVVSDGVVNTISRRLHRHLFTKINIWKLPSISRYLIIYMLSSFENFRLLVFQIVFSFTKNFKILFSRNQRYNTSFTIIITVTFLFLQIFTHAWKDILRVFNLSSKNVCNSNFQKHFSEEQITFIVAFMTIVVLIRIHKPYRFSIYIQTKYEYLLQSKFYKTIEDNLRESSNCCDCCFSCLNKDIRKQLLSLPGRLVKKLFVPISIFSTRNPIQTIAIFILYTYDILNIFTSIFSPFLVIPILKLIKNKGGILIDLLYQILHVLFIGLKFYPLLVLIDMKETWYTNLIAFLYTLAIWLMKVFNKGLCSRTEVYVQLAYDNINRIYQNNERVSNFNLTKRFQRSTESEEAKYEEKIRLKIPELFDETFKADMIQEDLLASFFDPSLTTAATATAASSSPFNASHKEGFTIIRPAKNQQITQIFDELYHTDDTAQGLTDLLRSLLENLPLYIALSYLLTSYLRAFVIIINKKTVKISERDRRSIKILKNDLKMNLLRRTNSMCDLCNDKYYVNDIKIRNTNYEYIENLIFRPGSYATSYGGMRLSKQFQFTYTVAFMLIYFCSVFLFRMTSVFGNMINRVVEFLVESMLSKDVDLRYLKDFDVFTEFRVAYVITSLLSAYQLLQSMLAFKQRVKLLNQGYKTTKKDKKSYFKLSDTKRSDVICSSLHYPGYLIAHLFYGYIILLFLIFILFVVAKLIFYLPFLSHEVVQFLLPIILMIFLKSTLVRMLMVSIFEFHCCKSTQSLSSYSTISYFNFFFDCFLGFMSCVNRIWKTSVISIFYVLRLDISMFNDKNGHTDFILNLLNLDKGHMAYLSFTYLEHSYNNQIISGFCEILIESMYQSFTIQENIQYSDCTCVDSDDSDDEIEENNSNIESGDVKIEKRKKTKNVEQKEKRTYDEAKQKYKSYAKLRNILFVYYTLQQYPTVKSYICQKKKLFPRLQSLESETSGEATVKIGEEIPSFTITNELFINFLKENNMKSDVRFKVNDQYFCYYTVSDEVYIENEAKQRIPKQCGSEYENKITCGIDYFLFSIWFTCFQFSKINLALKSKSKTSQRYRALDEISDAIELKNYDDARHLWYKQIGRIDENLEVSICEIQNLQMYKLEKTCTLCESVSASNGKEFFFKYINSKIILQNADDHVRISRCLDCNGHLTTQLRFLDTPIWLVVKFAAQCFYNHVPLAVTIGSQNYRLLFSIIKSNKEQQQQHYATVFYMTNKTYYLIDTHNEPTATMEKIKSNKSDVLYAIYVLVIDD